MPGRRCRRVTGVTLRRGVVAAAGRESPAQGGGRARRRAARRTNVRPHPDVAATVAAARAQCGYSDVDVETVFEDGVPAEVITRIAQDQHAAMIVVGSRGLGRATHLLGSTSEAVLARATIPVLIVPAGSSPAVGRNRTLTDLPRRSSRWRRQRHASVAARGLPTRGDRRRSGTSVPWTVASRARTLEAC